MNRDKTQQFNRMYRALEQIVKHYAGVDEMEELAEDVGLDTDEYLAMSYENIQGAALRAIQGVELIQEVPADE